MHLIVDGLEKRYGAMPPSVASLSFSLPRGELLGLLGPSGCGKTTTLRMVSGLVPATAGRIMVGGKDVTRLRPFQRNMGVMFQSYALFPHMTVNENVAFGLDMRKVPKAETARRVREALALVRLDAMGTRRPKELSGGQQQRVALARALVIEPDILLLDEPLSNLDAKLRDEMRNEIRDIQLRLGMTALFVTHDQVEAMAICDRIAVMRGGRLEQVGTPIEVYETPASPFVADFVGRMNHLPGRWMDGGGISAGGHLLRGRGTGPCGRNVVAMIRPHRIRISTDGPPEPGGTEANSVPGVVRRTTFIGDSLQYDVEALGSLVAVERRTRSGGSPIQPGTPVRLAWGQDDLLTFAADTAG